MDREELKNVRPEVRQWFDQMRSPGGQVCCSYADGHRTDYDMRQGQYWIPIEGEWYPVPPEAVIYDVNPIGDAVVWYLSQFVEGMTAAMLSAPYKIFCFVPSGGV